MSVYQGIDFPKSFKNHLIIKAVNIFKDNYIRSALFKQIQDFIHIFVKVRILFFAAAKQLNFCTGSFYRNLFDDSLIILLF